VQSNLVSIRVTVVYRHCTLKGKLLVYKTAVWSQSHGNVRTTSEIHCKTLP